MGSPVKAIRYIYDSRGNRKALINHDGDRTTYTYDAVNRIKSVENPQHERTTYSYDNAGRRTVKELANGTRASFSYDPAGNLTGLYNLKSDGTVVSSFDYEYDKVGNRKSVVEADGSRVTWTYDDTYQLTNEHRSGPHAYNTTYAYDPTGNRTLKVADGARTTTAYDAANQIQHVDDATGRTTYTYDADGNQQVVQSPNGDRTTYVWDYENRMTSAQLPSGVRNTMAYDADGLRVKLEESTGTKKFVWDDQNYLAETDENNDTQVVYTNEPRRFGNLISQRRGSTSDWYHFDAIGSTRELTDASAVITDTRLYDAWGVIQSTLGSTPYALCYVGELGYVFDTATFELYVRQRAYNVAVGRWLSTDPIGRVVTWRGPDYIYCRNSPLLYTDPRGLLEQSLLLTPTVPNRPDLPACAPCGEAHTFWEIRLSNRANHIRDGRRQPSVQAVVQFICISYDFDVCKLDEKFCCVRADAPKQRSCCFYEYLGELRTGFGLRASQRQLYDHWGTPNLSDPPCSSYGTMTINADVRTFDFGEVGPDLLVWSPGFAESGRRLTCGSIFLRASRHTADKPTWWDSPDIAWEGGSNSQIVEWNCCGDSSQSVFIESSSHGRETRRCE